MPSAEQKCTKMSSGSSFRLILTTFPTVPLWYLDVPSLYSSRAFICTYSCVTTPTATSFCTLALVCWGTLTVRGASGRTKCECSHCGPERVAFIVMRYNARSRVHTVHNWNWECQAVLSTPVPSALQCTPLACTGVHSARLRRALECPVHSSARLRRALECTSAAWGSAATPASARRHIHCLIYVLWIKKIMYKIKTSE